jgi:hypothetical protein
MDIGENRRMWKLEPLDEPAAPDQDRERETDPIDAPERELEPV